MMYSKHGLWLAGLVASLGFLGGAEGANAATSTFLQKTQGVPPVAAQQENCRGVIRSVIDATYEGVKTTTVIFGAGAGGGQGGQFDKTPVLTIPNVTITKGECLDAHFSAILGSDQTYGTSAETLFQVTLTPAGGGPIAMEGHYPTPYGIPSPAVATGAEPDVDMLAANFFAGGDADIPPGVYTVNVWWAGAPPGVAGGAIAAAFTLKLYSF